MTQQITKDIGMDVPAIAGGTPAKQTPIVKAPRYGEEELAELKEAIEQGTLFYSQGKKVLQLEEEFARKNGAKFAVCTTSGTASIHTAMIAAGISPGDEVIVTPITDMGSIVPILWQGAVPVFADLDPETYELDPDSVEQRITDKTKAVLAVHLWGNACDLDRLNAVCRKRDLVLIEDCAQAFGCLYKGKPVGTLGKIGCFSFNEFKHISCGDGGIVLTDDENLATRLRLATDKGYNRAPGVLERSATFLANNYRMTELQGAVALAQLKKLDSIVERRRNWCGALSKRLEGLKGISLPKETPGCQASWWFYMMRVQEDVLGASTDEFTEALKAEGLPVSAHYIGRCIYEYPIFVNRSAFDHAPHPFAAQNYGKGTCPTAEAILKTCVMLAINEGYTETDLDEITLAITRVANWFNSGKGSGGS